MEHFQVFEIPATIERDLVAFYRSAPYFPLDTLAGHREELQKYFGVYFLYYRGEFELYRDVAALNTEKPVKPIYVGKAVSSGGRTGRKGLSENSLYTRLIKHSRTIQAASESLRTRDFDFRVIPMKAALVQWAEQVMIRRLTPPWNTHVSGFGINDPGGRRYTQQRSVWDQIHPGRAFAPRMTALATYDLEVIRRQIAESADINLDTFED